MTGSRPDRPALVLVAALDRRRAIGRSGALPWHLPDDLRRFKRLTAGRPLLMGRRTAESLGRALPGRRNLVLTGSGRVPYDGMEPVRSLAEAVALVRGEPQLVVIGGGAVYERCLGIADGLHLTHVDTEVADADAWFPPFDPAEWAEVGREAHQPDERHAVGFVFVDYLRRVPARPRVASSP